MSINIYINIYVYTYKEGFGVPNRVCLECVYQ